MMHVGCAARSTLGTARKLYVRPLLKCRGNGNIKLCKIWQSLYVGPVKWFSTEQLLSGKWTYFKPSPRAFDDPEGQFPVA